MEKETEDLIEPKLKEIRITLKKHQVERNKNLSNLENVYKVKEKLQQECKNVNFKALKNLYDSFIQDANRETELLNKALSQIYEIRTIRYESLISKSPVLYADRPKGHIRKGDLLQLIHEYGKTLPLWIGKPDEEPPPLCGATPAEEDYVAKVGDMVVAYCNDFILAEVIHFNQQTNNYRIADIYEDKQEYLLCQSMVIPLPLMRVNPETHPKALFEEGTLVLALSPQTTCFYRAFVHKPPTKPHEEYSLIFEDCQYSSGYAPPVGVSQCYVVRYAEFNTS